MKRIRRRRKRRRQPDNETGHKMKIEISGDSSHIFTFLGGSLVTTIGWVLMFGWPR